MRAIFGRLGREGVAGGFVLLIGAALWMIVRSYPRGDVSQFGPGMVPWAASIGLVLLGMMMVARALRFPTEVSEPLVGRAAIMVPLGMAVFAFTLERAGLFAASAIGVLVTTFASRESGTVERVIIALMLASLVTAVFGYGLSMTMPLWPAFMRP
jgi:hypothetical protein